MNSPWSVAAKGLAVATITIGIVLLQSKPPADKMVVLLIETGVGQVYEAGSGSTCEEAKINARYPAGWVSMGCVEIR